MAFGIGPTLTMGAVEALDKHASDALKATYLRKARLRRVDGHDEPDRAAGRLRPRRAASRAPSRPATAPTASSARRSSSPMASTISPTTSSIWCWRGCPTRRPARAASRCSWCRNSWSTPTASLGARNDVFCAGIEHKLGIHGSPTCTMIYGDGFAKDRAPGAIGWLVGEENTRPRLHVHHDEQRPPCRRHAGRGGRRGRDPEGASPMPMSAGRARRAIYAGDGMAPIVHHPDVQRNLLTMKALTRVARAISYACAHAIDMARVARRRCEAPLAGARQSADADRQGVLHRCRRRGRLARRPGAWRHGLHRGDGRGALLPRRPHRADLRRHQRHPGDRPRHPQAAAGGRRACAWATSPSSAKVAAAIRTSNREGFGRTRRGARQGARRSARGDALPAGRAGRRAGRARRWPARRPISGCSRWPPAAPIWRKAALADDGQDRIALCRFFAENLLGETAALKERVIGGAESLVAAGAALVRLTRSTRKHRVDRPYHSSSGAAPCRSSA